jgi:hypothetical protein
MISVVENAEPNLNTPPRSRQYTLYVRRHRGSPVCAMLPKMEGSITAMKYSRGLNRVYGLLCGIWFLAWLVGFPLYTRSNDLRDAEFFVQYIYIPTTFEAETPPKPTPPKPTAEEIEQIKQLVERQESFLKDNPRLAFNDRAFRAELHRIYGRRTGLARNQVLRVAQEQAGLFKTYKQLWKSNWRNWGPYVLLGPLIVYAAIYALILAVGWVVQGFQKS